VRRLALLLALCGWLAASFSAPAAAQEPVQGWADLANGGYFTTGADEIGLLGYAILDEPNGPPFWTTYVLLGGRATLGAPLSRPFVLPDAHIHQLFEYGMLRWHPGATGAVLADTLDLMSAAGRDTWLQARGVPAVVPLDDQTQDQATVTRLGWLTVNVIRDSYYSAPYPGLDPSLAAALLRYGLPSSPPEPLGDGGMVQRFQRAALRLVRSEATQVTDVTEGIDVTDAAGGTGEAQPVVGITQVPVGILLVESGLLPYGGPAMAPDRMIGGQLVARVQRPFIGWPNSRGWGIPEPAMPSRMLVPATVSPGGASDAPANAPVPAVPAMPVTPTPLPVLAVIPTPSPPPSLTPTSTAGVMASPRRSTQAPFATVTALPAAPLRPGAAPVIKLVVNEGRTERVVILNDGTVAQELTGWTLRSVTGSQSFAFPAGLVLAPGASVSVHSGSGAASRHQPPSDLFATGAAIWRNEGDTAQLIDPSGRVIHQLVYGG